ncbi:glycoside hydrolase family 3 protein [Paenibacillus glycanilyticus]|uniref:glycoside hydrolase family 3 protein n=1 Tax=Paenibacillus glycanilyticus TaxID=126569 RepID=UPI00191018AC|nr:glycoside hydrolase family 3 N-terminal domain-containing protein [Paenibacillus glycanilyticus]
MKNPIAATLEQASIQYVTNDGGPTLGYCPASGARIIEQDGLKFKDLSKDGQLHPYEDWRLTADERARDLASRMTIEQIAGLMLYSSHQNVPSPSVGFFTGTYGGKPFEEAGVKAWTLSDQQAAFLSQDYVRHVLVMAISGNRDGALWSNQMQAFAEAESLGIPVNISSDPRHGIDIGAEFTGGAGSRISKWPETLGLAATFDPSIVRQFGEVASREYRALGIATALSPQIDIATDPRWFRFSGTFGEDPLLSTDMARAYVDGFQTSDAGSADGWGAGSVNAMVKHWPGGGSGEGGRDAHFGFGKYAVYPGNNFEEHLEPFVNGAFKLEGKTGEASAVMPYYTISHGRDDVYGENVGNSYNKYLITDLLREKYGYDGVVCTDWNITADEGAAIESMFGGKSWGVEGLSVAERHYKLLMAGVDQFGGNNDSLPVLEAYRMGVDEHGEAYMRERFEKSAVRLLKNIFRVGLFENPYLDAEQSEKLVASEPFVRAGHEAQLKSVVMVKNKKQALPLKPRSRVYIPSRYTAPEKHFIGFTIPERDESPIDLALAEQFFDIVENPGDADFAIVAIRGAKAGLGYSREDAAAGGNGYVPISLQYRPYTAEHARETSLAGDARERDVLNRSYQGKTVTTHNESDLDLVLETKSRMGEKPVIVTLFLVNPTVMEEFETSADAILVHFGSSDKAMLELLSGQAEPSGLLPLQLPANMRTVEEQFEDVPHDMACHVDDQHHAYDFGFGMNWQGVIEDDRTRKYGRKRS